MKERFKTPHTFDMSEYFFGRTYVLGGRDYDREEKEIKKLPEIEVRGDKKISMELDWSFLKSRTRTRLR
ncbi:hypothetical protein [Peredibacter starrii]|uniref:Uncharacterized protein n=1 Tax=Peredibacter starrii TaxID=28202 RepID=A0AAX4HUT2_9BACT|nr:hypothetical protein [Peredibacter starrii]WPU66935.1 hypothetical protein SOO65_09250 [Peredibacter starrii]